MNKIHYVLLIALSMAASTVIASDSTPAPTGGTDLVWPCWSWDPSCIPYNDVT